MVSFERVPTDNFPGVPNWTGPGVPGDPEGTTLQQRAEKWGLAAFLSNGDFTMVFFDSMLIEASLALLLIFWEGTVSSDTGSSTFRFLVFSAEELCELLSLVVVFLAAIRLVKEAGVTFDVAARTLGKTDD